MADIAGISGTSAFDTFRTGAGAGGDAQTEAANTQTAVENQTTQEIEDQVTINADTFADAGADGGTGGAAAFDQTFGETGGGTAAFDTDISAESPLDAPGSGGADAGTDFAATPDATTPTPAPTTDNSDDTGGAAAFNTDITADPTSEPGGAGTVQGEADVPGIDTGALETDPLGTNQRETTETQAAGNDTESQLEANRTLGQVVDVFA
jgi:hypothetical protein